ncbi:serine/threonine-protein kinase [Spirillospora albida]|uniref:serine/threonine-protein kinase n=1 Tax=Spirillospora albida TaxID=58123 RepID=UPI0006913689|nr:serine/threonine-protein kinase [Spirillospora albida]
MSPQPLTAADPVRLGGCELLGRIGAGGQGIVYLGRPLDPASGLPPRVAVKLLHGRLLADASARARFVRELALLQRVAGFCTAQMLAADTAGDRPYIVSEYVPGRSLRELVRDEGPRAGADLDRLAIGTVTALTAIHRAGIVHRDFKPQNVLMGPDGPRVIDFGIARAFDAGATMTSQPVGTPAYMAPEQIAGRTGPATDLFAWAGTLLFAATGRDPFAGGAIPAVMYRIMHETPDLAPLPPRLAEVAAACLAKDPAARPTSEEALLWLIGERSRHPTSASEPAAESASGLPTVPAPAAPPDGRLSRPEPAPADHLGSPPAQDRPGVPAMPGPPDGHGPTRVQDRPGQHGTGAPGAPHAPGRGRAGLRRGPAVITGLVLAGLLAVLDVAALAILIARPDLSEGHRGGLLPVVAASFAVVAVVTLVAVILAWRGSRAAAWTVLAARVARVAMWGGWAMLVTVEPAALAGHAALSALVVVLLAYGLRAAPGVSGRAPTTP